VAASRYHVANKLLITKAQNEETDYQFSLHLAVVRETGVHKEQFAANHA